MKARWQVRAVRKKVFLGIARGASDPGHDEWSMPRAAFLSIQTVMDETGHAKRFP